MKKSILLIAVALSLVGCANTVVHKDMVAISGNKAGATIKMGYTQSSYEDVIVNMQKAKDDASQKCQSWGYKSAEPFGGETKQCINRQFYGNNNVYYGNGGYSNFYYNNGYYGQPTYCTDYEVSVVYQCLD